MSEPAEDPLLLADQESRAAERRSWWRSHGYSALSSLGRFVRSPFSHLLTIGVIAIALTLPALGYIGLKNMRHLSGTLQEPADVNVFLKMPMDQTRAGTLARQVRDWEGVRDTQLKTPDEALSEFRELTQFSDALSALGDNPLPWVLTLKLGADYVEVGAVDQLMLRLRALPEVDMVQFDREWVVRLKALLALGDRAVLIIGSLLGIAVLLVIGNTIRLEIGQRREEIIIIKLVGASDAFVRRPFLYSGLWFGLVGALTALLLITVGVQLLTPAVADLAEAYAGRFELRGLGLSETALVLGLGVSLGLSGAYLASLRHLAEAEPQ